MANAIKTKTSDPVVIRAPHCFPLKKGDIVIERTSAFYLNGDVKTYYDLNYVAKGGKNPREKSGAPIYTEKVVAVIRKGWELPTITGWADSIEEAVELAMKYRP